MTERSRPRLLAWAAVLLALLAVLAVLVTHDRAPLGQLDELGRDAEAWADDHGWLVETLRWVETVPAYRLGYGDLDQAIEWVRSLLRTA